LIRREFSHWDTWVGPKKPTLFSVRLHKDSDDKWILGNEFINVLKGTEHVRVCYVVKGWFHLNFVIISAHSS